MYKVTWIRDGEKREVMFTDLDMAAAHFAFTYERKENINVKIERAF